MRLVVAGSGIVGSACAYVASSLGAQVTLVDAGRPGQATAAGAGSSAPGPPGSAIQPRTRWPARPRGRIPRSSPNSPRWGSGTSPTARSGRWSRPARADELERARASLEARHAGNPEMGDVRVITGPQAQARVPPLRAGLAAVHIPGAARVDGAEGHRCPDPGRAAERRHGQGG